MFNSCSGVKVGGVGGGGGVDITSHVIYEQRETQEHQMCDAYGNLNNVWAAPSSD